MRWAYASLFPLPPGPNISQVLSKWAEVHLRVLRCFEVLTIKKWLSDAQWNIGQFNYLLEKRHPLKWEKHGKLSCACWHNTTSGILRLQQSGQTKALKGAPSPGNHNILQSPGARSCKRQEHRVSEKMRLPSTLGSYQKQSKQEYWDLFGQEKSIKLKKNVYRNVKPKSNKHKRLLQYLHDPASGTPSLMPTALLAKAFRWISRASATWQSRTVSMLMSGGQSRILACFRWKRISCSADTNILENNRTYGQAQIHILQIKQFS